MATHAVLSTDLADDAALGSPIPLLDLRAQYESIRDEVMHAIGGVMESQHFILGPEVEALEREIASYIGVSFAVGCASGSDALLLAQMALGIGFGDEVITTAFTFGATAGSILRLGARPVFVDIDPETFNLDVERIEAAITPKTRAIMPVHLFGLPAEMDAVMTIAAKHSLAVIEDAAQAIGARWCDRMVGSFGACGCFSFFPSKNLGCAGDGGLITTDDAELAQRLRILRAHGTRRKYHYEMLGINSRLDALQAAILRVKLQHLNEWNAGRRANAEVYRELFAERGLEVVQVPTESPMSYHVYNQYSIRAAHRDSLMSFLKENGIGTEVYYPTPLHLEPAFAHLANGAGSMPGAEAACGEVLALPIYPELTHVRQRRVVDTIARFYGSQA